MSFVARYRRLMDIVHYGCVAIAGVALVIITVVIPWGVFTRYVLNNAASWPEPMAILLMIWLSFLSALICYREHLHITVMVVPNLLGPVGRRALGFLAEMLMLSANLFLLWYGLKLVEATWYQSIAEFPIVSVGVSYLPIPIGGALTVLFVIERLLTGEFYPPPVVLDDPQGAPISSE